jgi:hypothetical protein
MPEHIGYARLIERFRLDPLPLRSISVISSTLRSGSRRTRDLGGQILNEFHPNYRVEDTLVGDLQFALRYEGLNLEVLALLFDIVGPEPILQFLAAQPNSAYARRLAYLFEWLTGRNLELPSETLVPTKAAFIPVLDESLQFGMTQGPRNAKFRVVDNLPGDRSFCPLVSKTPYLLEMVSKDLKQRTLDRLAKYPADLLRRAAAFLYLKETHSSFEVEREKPSPDRARRFADLLREAESGEPLSEQRLVELQNAVVDPRFAEASYRQQQNWIGDDLGYRKRIVFVPPRPEDVRPLMDGIVALSERVRRSPESIEPVVAAAAISFGFVFVHPFMDGNGRLHRYLIHETLSTAGFTPKGIVLPVSAVILANMERYVSTLEAFSKQLRDRTSFNPDVPNAPATGNDAVHFRYFDATDQASFLFYALERTVEHDLDEEISFLLGFDRARAALNNLIDWPAHSLDLFIRVVHQNNNRLSKTKRLSHFDWMRDDEVTRFEEIVARSFQREEERPAE